MVTEGMESVHPLRAYREAQEPPITQRALAHALGVDRLTVWRWENRLRRPDRELLLKINQLTGVPIERLLVCESEAVE